MSCLRQRGISVEGPIETNVGGVYSYIPDGPQGAELYSAVDTCEAEAMWQDVQDNYAPLVDFFSVDPEVAIMDLLTCLSRHDPDLSFPAASQFSEVAALARGRLPDEVFFSCVTESKAALITSWGR